MKVYSAIRSSIQAHRAMGVVSMATNDPMMVVQVPSRSGSESRRPRGTRANAAKTVTEKRQIGLHYPPVRVRNIRTVAAFSNDLQPADWIWQHIEEPLNNDLKEMGVLLTEGVTSGAPASNGRKRRRSAVPVETKQLGIHYPEERIQQLHTVAAFQGVTVSEWIWGHIEEPLTLALVNLWQTLRKEVGNGKRKVRG